MHAGEHHGFQEGSTSGRVGVVRGVTVIVLAVAIGAFLVIRGIDNGGDEVVAASDSATADEGSSEGFVDDDGPADGSASTGDGALGSGTTVPSATTTDGTAIMEEGAPHDGAADDGAPDDGGLEGEIDDGTSGDGTVDGDSVGPTPAGPSAPEAVTVLVLNAAPEKGVAGRGTEYLGGLGYTVLPPRNADVLGPSAVLYTGGNEADAVAVAEALDVDPAAVVGELDPASPPMNDYGAADVIVVIGNDGVIDVSGV